MSGGYAAYDARPGVRSTHLKQVLEAPAVLRYHLDHPGAGATASRLWLQSVHAAILEPDVYRDAFAVYPGVRNGRQYDAWRDSHPGVRALSAREDLLARQIAGAVQADPVAGPRLREEGALPEHGVYWTDEDTGLPCKALIDLWRPGSEAVDDLKTVQSTERHALASQAVRLGWHVQLAHYRAGVRAVYDVDPACSLICVESAAPHLVGVFTATAAFLDMGERARREGLERIAACKRTGLWPGRHTEPVDLDPPAWALPGDELGAEDDGLDIDLQEDLP